MEPTIVAAPLAADDDLDFQDFIFIDLYLQLLDSFAYRINTKHTLYAIDSPCALPVLLWICFEYVT